MTVSPLQALADEETALEDAVDLSSTDLRLTAELLQVQTAWAATSLRASVVVRYCLYERANDTLVFLRDIRSSERIEFEDASRESALHAEAIRRAVRASTQRFIRSLEEFRR